MQTTQNNIPEPAKDATETTKDAAQQAPQIIKEARTNVRFTPTEFKRVSRDSLMSRRSIPWLLKSVYFKGELKPPLLDADTRRAVMKELGHIGNNLNQIARKVNTGLVLNIETEVVDLLNLFRTFKRYLGSDYGNR